MYSNFSKTSYPIQMFNRYLQKIPTNLRMHFHIDLKNFIFRVYSILLFALSLILLAPTDFFRPMKTGLDNSYRIAFHLIAKEKMVYGEDIVFAYGPLSYLASRHPVYINKIQFLIVDSLVFFTAVFILIFTFRNLKTYTSIFLAFLSILSLRSVGGYIYALDRMLYLMLLFLIFYHRKYNKFLLLLVGFIFSIIGFYLKLSSGFPIVLTIILYLIFSLIYPGNNSRKSIFVYVLIYSSLFIIGTLLVQVDLKKYFIGSYHVISGYNDAMFIEFGSGGAYWTLLYIAVTILIIYAVILLANLKMFTKNVDYFFMYIITGLFLLSFYKYGIVRYGPNLRSFFGLTPVAIGFLILFSPQWNRKNLEKYFILVLMFTYPVWHLSYNHEYIIDKIESIPTYISEVADSDKSAIGESELSEAVLPENILKTIGDRTVDIFPWEISIIYKNGLNYSPRPMIQTHMAYDEYLDRRNFNYLISTDAPEYILFSMTDFELRYPFFDEPITKLAILTNYKIIEKFDGYLSGKLDRYFLMEKRKNPIRYTSISSDVRNVSLNEYIEIGKSDNLVFINTDIEYSLLGSVVRAIYQPPRLKVTFQFEGGEERTYNAPVSIVRGDGLINKFVPTINSAEYLFLFGGKFNKNVERLKYHTDQKWGFKPEFDYTLKQVDLEHGRFDKLQVVNQPLSNHLDLQGFYINEITPDSLYIDLVWACNKNNEPQQFPYYANINLSQDASIFSSDADILIACPPDTYELISTRHRIILDSTVPTGPFNVKVNLFQDLDGEQILSGSTTVENVNIIK